jgi:SAM-dependent methyltransferase
MVLKIIKAVDYHLGLRTRLRGMPPKGFDLDGEKVLDWGWCLAHLPHAPKQRILDVGCVQAPITPAAIALGHEVIGVDTDRLNYSLPNLTFIQADFMDVNLIDVQFDIVVLCSVVEHIGLGARYGQREIPDGDINAMGKVASLLKSEGRLILTIPVGRDMVFHPWHRIYGVERLPQLLRGFTVEQEHYLLKPVQANWCETIKADALQVDRAGISYALGQFVLKQS